MGLRVELSLPCGLLVELGACELAADGSGLGKDLVSSFDSSLAEDIFELWHKLLPGWGLAQVGLRKILQ